LKKTLKYFLAANSCQGFVSYFDKCYNPYDQWKAYIIKGGPGTGKSSFMRKIAQKAQNKNEEFILCPCSSDPNSLDAVIFPNKKTVIMDGTAPHCVDPRYPAVCEEILNFGQFWDTKKVTNGKEIIEITNQNKKLHKTVANYLFAAGKIIKDSYKTVDSCIKTEKVKNFALSLCEKYIEKSNGKPYEWKAFLGGVTPQGIITYPETVTNSCDNIIVISDSQKAVSNIIMNTVRAEALKNGHFIITLENPLLPNLCEHIIIPKLSLCFVTEDQNTLFDTNVRRIHAQRFIDRKKLNLFKERLKLNKKFTENLLSSATDTLKKAKAVHDNLESYYINAMDFTALNKFTEDFAKKCLLET